MEIIARDESRPWSVRFWLYVLSLFKAENDLSMDTVVASIVSTSWSNFITSEIVCIRSFWAKKLKSCPGDLHSFLTVCELYSPMRSVFSLTKSKNLAYSDRLCSLVSSKCSDQTKESPQKWSNLVFSWTLISSRMLKNIRFFSSLTDFWLLSGWVWRISVQITHRNCQTPVSGFPQIQLSQIRAEQNPMSITLFCSTLKSALVSLKMSSYAIMKKHDDAFESHLSYPAAIIRVSLSRTTRRSQAGSRGTWARNCELPLTHSVLTPRNHERL